jgi:hypothetical protein
MKQLFNFFSFVSIVFLGFFFKVHGNQLNGCSMLFLQHLGYHALNN